MKKIITIICILCQLAIKSQVISAIVPGGATSCASPPSGQVSTTFGSQFLTAGNVYIMFVFCDSSHTYPTVTTQSWSTVLQVGSFARRIAVYCYVPSSSGSVSITIAASGGSFPASLVAAYYSITNTINTNNGLDAIVSTAVDSANGADPTITTLSSFARAGVIAAFINNSNPFGGTPESGWTEDFDNGCSSNATYTNGFYLEHRSFTSDNTPSVTKTSSDWMGVALQIHGRRKAVVTN